MTNVGFHSTENGIGLGALRATTALSHVELVTKRSRLRRELLSPDALPIPANSKIAAAWSGQMLEMAEHIGIYATLKFINAYGGEYMYFSAGSTMSELAEVIGAEKAEIMRTVYGGERIHVPTGRGALLHARRQPVIAAVRAGKMSSSDAARLLRTTPPYISRLVNHTDEGEGFEPIELLERREIRLIKDAVAIVEEELSAAGVAPDVIARVAANLADLVN